MTLFSYQTSVIRAVEECLSNLPSLKAHQVALLAVKPSPDLLSLPPLPSQCLGLSVPSTHAATASLAILSGTQPVSLFQISAENLRQSRFKSVGRWPDRTSNRWNDHSKFETVSMSSMTDDSICPEELMTVSKEQHGSFILFTDKEPYSFLDYVDSRFPLTQKVITNGLMHQFGIIGTQTPFLTGTPHFMKLGKDSFGSGLIGAFVPTSSPVDSHLQYPSLSPIGSPLLVKRCQGNIVLEVESGNPTQELIHQLGNNVRKVVDLYAAFSSHQSMTDPMVYKITSGDPSRGYLSVETIKDLPPGLYMQFMKMSNDPASISRESMIEFNSCTEEELSILSPSNSTFSVKSECGFIFSKPNQQGRNALSGSLVSDIPGSSIGFSIKGDAF